jgi:hypothetical protein
VSFPIDLVATVAGLVPFEAPSACLGLSTEVLELAPGAGETVALTSGCADAQTRETAVFQNGDGMTVIDEGPATVGPGSTATFDVRAASTAGGVLDQLRIEVREDGGTTHVRAVTVVVTSDER